jgi:hypothetical protein
MKRRIKKILLFSMTSYSVIHKTMTHIFDDDNDDYDDGDDNDDDDDDDEDNDDDNNEIMR